ncbi:MAG: hypothetical protein EA408_07840 [Marinilabiliales bacterium]|nr:MAG: hypothetical protein EA408_07840 [Marinilabiliales bacterium]
MTLSFTACDEFAPTIKVPFESDSEFSITSEEPALKSGESYPLLHEWVYTESISSLITEKGGNPEKIRESNITGVTFTLVNTDAGNLADVISHLELKIDEHPPVSQTLVARSSEISANSISFEIILDDILDYVVNDGGMTFSLYGVADKEAIEEDLEVKISVSSEMVVQLL